MSWRVEFFVDERGHAPIEDFFASLPVEHRAKLLALVRMLEHEGPSLPFPYCSQIHGKLRELRAQQGKDNLRVFYFGDATRTFILLHGIVKRSRNTPEQDIRIAEQRMESHMRRIEGRNK